MKRTTNYTNNTNNFAAFAANGTNLCRFASPGFKSLRGTKQSRNSLVWIASLSFAMTQSAFSFQFVSIRTLASQILDNSIRTICEIRSKKNESQPMEDMKRTTNYTNNTNNFAAFAANGTNLCRFASPGFASLRGTKQSRNSLLWIASLSFAMTQSAFSFQFVSIRTFASQIIFHPIRIIREIRS